MKKILYLLLVFVILPTLFAGCDNKNDNAISESNTYYFDETNISIAGVHFEISCSEYALQNTNLTITLTVTNTNLQDKAFALDNLKIVSEETNVEYNCSSNLYGSTTLQYNIKTNITITSVIPISYQTDNYYLKFTTLGKRCVIKLYEMPDELRTEHTISFKVYTYPNYVDISQNLVVKHNRVANQFVWEDNNHKNFCDTWYTDEGRTQLFSWNSKITGDVTLYGLKNTNVSTNYDSSGTYVTGIRHVPNDGILVIDKFSGKVFISNYGIHNNNQVKEIYLPKELRRIYFGNFSQMNALTKIHFEGSETEWNSIETSSAIPTNISIVFNSIYQ
ncbi:MAG: hypothetical protein SPF07_02025 [Eubacteriales bacterium]|nr:hypothetical protein [Eubacteriales bacterium]